MFISRIVPEMTVYDKVRTHVSACKTRDRGFPRFSATPISFANVRFWYTRTDELALPELGMLFIGRFWFTTKPQTNISGTSQNWAFENVRFWYTRNGYFWYYTRTNVFQKCCLLTDSGIPQTNISGSCQNWAFENVRFWYTRNGHFWYYTRTNVFQKCCLLTDSGIPQTNISGSCQNWAFENVRFWYTRNGHFWYYTGSAP